MDLHIWSRYIWLSYSSEFVFLSVFLSRQAFPIQVLQLYLYLYMQFWADKALLFKSHLYLYLYFWGDKPLLFKSPPSPHSRLKLPRLDLVPGSSLCVPDTMSKDGKANMSFSQNLFCKLFHCHIVLEEQNKAIEFTQVGRRWLLTRRWTSFCPKSVWNF